MAKKTRKGGRVKFQEAIPIENVHIIENSRGDFKDAEISELMTSMRQQGLLQPIGVRPSATRAGHYEVIYGNRRLEAARKLGWKHIDCVIKGDSTRSKETEIAFIIKNASENLQRRDPSFVEQGRLFDQLIRKGLDKKEIAARIGISETRVESIIHTYSNTPRYLREKIVLNDRGVSREGKINIKMVKSIETVVRKGILPRPKATKLYDYALKKGSSSEKINGLAKLMSQGASLEAAVKYIGSVKSVTVHFHMTEPAIDAVEKANGGIKINELIYRFVRDSKKFPLAKISSDLRPKIIVRKKNQESVAAAAQ